MGRQVETTFSFGSGRQPEKIIGPHDSVSDGQVGSRATGESSRKVISIRAPSQKFDLTLDGETYVTSL